MLIDWGDYDAATRTRGRPDYRLRRIRRGGGMVAGRDQNAHPLPGAGRLAEPRQLSVHWTGLGGTAVLRYGHLAEPAPALVRLPGQRRQLADQGAELQRRWR